MWTIFNSPLQLNLAIITTASDSIFVFLILMIETRKKYISLNWMLLMFQNSNVYDNSILAEKKEKKKEKNILEIMNLSRKWQTNFE